jgi:hypothetical protein
MGSCAVTDRQLRASPPVMTLPLGPWRVLLFHQAGRLVVAPGLCLRLGRTAPLHLIFAAQRHVRALGGELDQSVAAFPFSHRLGRH